MLGAFTEQYSLLFLGARTLESFRDFGIFPGFAGVVVSDRYVNYFHPGWEYVAGHQACLSHLLGTIRTPPRPTRARLARAGAAGTARPDPRLARRPRYRPGRDPRRYGRAADPEFRRAVRAGLASVPRIPGPKNSTAQHPGRDLLEFCRDREDDVLRFTTDTRIWPTNNISERGVRPLKTQQKISGRLTSEDATQDRLDIRSYIDTAATRPGHPDRPARPVHRHPLATAGPSRAVAVTSPENPSHLYHPEHMG